MMRVIFAAVTALLLCMATLKAQERAPNPGTQPLLRAWPDSGIWGVGLFRLVDGALGCLLVTGHINPKLGEQYYWGIRWRRESVGATLTDNNQRATAGLSIQIVIDGIPTGTYPITKRTSGNSGAQNVVAEFPAGEKDRVLNLIDVGGSMQFVTNNFTYSASLQGARRAMTYFRACIVEASHLNASGTAPSGPFVQVAPTRPSQNK